MCTRNLLWTLPVTLALSLACNTVPGEKYQAVQRELLTTQDQVKRLESQITDQEQTISRLQGQVAQMRGIDPKNLDQLVVPAKIALERQSGGYDEDGKTGDDGVVLYVQVFDRDNDVIKAAGSINVTLLDLANPPDRYVIGEYRFDADKTRSLWYGRMWTHHYTVRCPWFQGRPPAHSEITARVEFVDLLTGRKLATQGTFTIQFPPGHVAAGQ